MLDKEDCIHYKEFTRFNYFTEEFEFYQQKYEAIKYKLNAIKEWNSCDKSSENCYIGLMRKQFGREVPVEKYRTQETMSYNVFKKYRFKVDGKTIYPREKINKFVEELKEIWYMKDNRINNYLKRFLPNIECKVKGVKKDKYYFEKRKNTN